MRLTCPNCLTEYDVPDEAVAGRSRTLRCAYCGHQWRHDAPAAAVEETGAIASPEPVTPEPAAPEPAAPIIDVPPLTSGQEPAAAAPVAVSAARTDAVAARPAAVRRVVAQPPARRNRTPLAIGLLVVLTVVVALAAHAPIMHAWPASARFYQALGIK